MSTERRPRYVDANARWGQLGFHEGIGSDGWSVTLDGVEQIHQGKPPYIGVANATEGWIDFYREDGRDYERKHGKVVIEWSSLT